MYLFDVLYLNRLWEVEDFTSDWKVITTNLYLELNLKLRTMFDSNCCNSETIKLESSETSKWFQLMKKKFQEDLWRKSKINKDFTELECTKYNTILVLDNHCQHVV